MSGDRIPWETLAPARRLFLAHLRADPGALALFGRGRDDAAVAAAAAERRAVPLPHRAALVDALAAYGRSLGAPAAALEAAARIADPRTVVVTGGQQPQVGGGALFAFAKAAGVVALARRLEAAGAGPVVAVWWVASEDHDVAEAGDVRLAAELGGSDLLAAGSADRRMLSRVPAPALPADRLGGGEFAPAVLPLFAPPRGAALGRAAAAVFSRLLGPKGLVVVEPHVVAPLAREVFARDVRSPGDLAAVVREGNAAVRAAGFEAVLADPEGPLHFRVDEEGRRTRGGGVEADLDAIDERLSADVALRVLVQDAALPIAAQVAGPTEAEYLAALGPAHAAAGVFRPAVVARPGVTVLGRRMEESLAALGADLGALYARGAAALGTRPSDAADPLASEARRLVADLRRSASGRAALAPAVRRKVEAAERALTELEQAAVRARDEERGVGETRRRKILDALLPDGLPQERKWGLLPLMLRHGPGLADLVFDACAGPETGHRVVRPEERGGAD